MSDVPGTSQTPVLELQEVGRFYRQAGVELPVLKGAQAQIRQGEIVALVGPSGSGKSTLLHLAGLLEYPDAGRVILNGRDCASLPDLERTRLRRTDLGFVYQHHHLLPEFSALENIVIPQRIAGLPKKQAEKRAHELLRMLDIGARADHRPARLSGGEQQRVAIGRALANGPRLLLADEPTGNLDPQTAEAVFAHLISLCKTVGLAALVATHNPVLASRMDRVLSLRDGLLVAD